MASVWTEPERIFKWAIQGLVCTKQELERKKKLSAHLSYLVCVYIRQRVVYVYKNDQKVDFT